MTMTTPTWIAVKFSLIHNVTCHFSVFRFLQSRYPDPPSLDDIRTKANQIKQRLFLSQNEITELERKTKRQSETDEWNLHRKYRITASKCHRVATLKKSTSPTKAVQEILHDYKQQCQTSKMKEGMRREK